jgi:tetratricopeptide (TPR) repeat protein
MNNSKDDATISVTKEENNTCTEDEPPQLPFVTTSDVLNQLNTQLQNLSGAAEASLHQPPRFELQKRLPDGSAIPASDRDLAASDLQTKLQQSAKFVSLLENDQEKFDWADQQRKTGNAYYKHGDYISAMDIYLTCLVVKDHRQEFTTDIYFPVLNNLASCTLQLSMYKKTILFCDIGLEKEVGLDLETAPSSSRLFLAKLYFKRAKAYRLTGEYRKARMDLTVARKTLGQYKWYQGEDTTSTSTSTVTTECEQAIAKELGHLETAEREGRKNRLRAQKGIQKALNVNVNNHNNSNKGPSSSTISAASPDDFSKGLYSDQGPRKYSALRVRKTTSTPAKKSADEKKPKSKPLSYSAYYWAVVSRVTETLLVWLGDEEVIKELQAKQEHSTKKD